MSRKKTAPPEAFIAAVILTEAYLVTRDRVPCTLVNVSGMHRGGVLIPGAPVVTFTKPRDARRAVERTEAAREKLRGSLVSEWLAAQFPELSEGGTYEVVPCGHQAEPKPAALPVARRMPVAAEAGV